MFAKDHFLFEVQNKLLKALIERNSGRIYSQMFYYILLTFFSKGKVKDKPAQCQYSKSEDTIADSPKPF